MNKNIYRQADSRWASLPYPKGSTFGGCGCGCCACLHVMIELDKYKNWTPKDLRPYMVNQGFAIRNQGTLWAGITKTLQHYGFSVINHPNMKSVWATLKDRKYKFGVILFRGGSRGGVTWTTGGHYVAFVDYKVQNGKHYFYCKDSGGRHHDGWYCYETTMAGLIPQIWTADPPAGSIGGGDAPVPSVDPTPTPGKLAVDGKFGPASIKALQKKMGTTQDGKISGQSKSLKKYHSGFSSSISYGSGGSNCIRALQKMLKLSDPDGELGPNTIKAFQKYLGLSNPDGYWGPNTSKAVQKWLNGDLKPVTNSSSSSSASKTPSTPAATPTKSVYKVIDVSVWQGDIDWAKVKADGVDGAIIRYADGSTLDSKFDKNMKAAKAQGLHVGAYIFSRAKTKAAAEKEAERLYNACKQYNPDMPLYIDLEASSLSSYANQSAFAFINKMKALGGKPGIYANLNWFNNYIKTANYTSYPLWIAQYNSKITHKHPNWFGMWQYSSSGSVKGIKGRVDMNKCYVAYWDQK